MTTQRHTRTLFWEVSEHAETGAERAAHVTPLVGAYSELFGDGSLDESTYCDLIADLLHAWAAQTSCDTSQDNERVEKMLQRAVTHFLEERAEEHER